MFYRSIVMPGIGDYCSPEALAKVAELNQQIADLDSCYEKLCEDKSELAEKPFDEGLEQEAASIRKRWRSLCVQSRAVRVELNKFLDDVFEAEIRRLHDEAIANIEKFREAVAKLFLKIGFLDPMKGEPGSYQSSWISWHPNVRNTQLHLNELTEVLQGIQPLRNSNEAAIDELDEKLAAVKTKLLNW